MELINDLGTDLALAFLVERRYRQKIESVDALALIDQVRDLLESSSVSSSQSETEQASASASAH